MKTRLYGLTLLVAMQALFLLAWAGYQEMALRSGTELRLETRPVDPRDILRGDYMILSYAISRHPVPFGWSPSEGDEVFVTLAPEGRFYAVSFLSYEEPGRTESRIWARATVSRVVGDVLWLDYGIERYFVPEGMGTPTFQTMEVVVVTDASHRLYIKELWLDGKTYP